MPLYEFYCEPCHTVFTFRSARVDTVTLPSCPRCGKALRREVSPFAHIVRGAVTEPGCEPLPGEGVSRIEEAAARLGERLQALEDDGADPADAVRTMKELAAAEGLHFNKEVREAMARIEAGEDPEKIDGEFSEVFDTVNPFADGDGEEQKRGTAWLRRLRGPAHDPKWYDLTPTTGDGG
ncbi:MAG TPA: zinc ribbon domain-containing protein [Kiritimatiellia bacterium]|nr:zinc ribbon domain-containing protein [Kiritimatiellia bacterium]HPS08161.1 zinc ribbon domain-containing protein [Kiritimatiellia bacterium]